MVSDFERAIRDRAEGSDSSPGQGMTAKGPWVITRNPEKRTGQTDAYAVVTLAGTGGPRIVRRSMISWEVEGERDIAVLSPSRSTATRVDTGLPPDVASDAVAVVETLDGSRLRLVLSGEGPSGRIMKPLE